MIDKIVASATQAVTGIHDGATTMVGGFGIGNAAAAA
jgi:acyl CoA:acetate/3-ketoacid CoA transferase alpha subunit